MTRYALISCLAGSAGIHAALAAGHGLSFHVAAALLGAGAALLALRPGRAPAAAAGVLLAGLLAAYAVEHGLPADGTSSVAKLVEALGLLLATRLALGPSSRRTGRLAALATAAAIAALAAALTPAGGHADAPGTPPHGH